VPAARKERLCDINMIMLRVGLVGVALLCGMPLLGQAGPRLWVLRGPGEMVEYDPATFAAKQTVKVPAEAVQSPQNVAVNHPGQILFAPAVSLPLSEADVESAHKVWIWNGQAASSLDPGLKREAATTGSNQAVTESAASVFLSADGDHLYWFANSARRLQREDVDLSAAISWQAWRTDLAGEHREDIATVKMPDCRCPTGACEESCPYGVVWVPDAGLVKFFLLTQFVAGKTEPTYRTSAIYQLDGGNWTAKTLAEPLRRVLDATSGGEVVVEAIPDTGCCGWSNQSDDQTQVVDHGKATTVFDELATYKNPDYDVSFYTSNAQLSPERGFVAMTIVSTAQAGKAIQLAEQGQANPEESKQIRAGLGELPAVEVKSLGDAPRRIAFVPHAALVGWLNEKEVLIVEDRVLVAFNPGTGARRKSNVRVEDAAHVFLR